MEKLNIVHISDFHFDDLKNKHIHEKIKKLFVQEKPDVIQCDVLVINGDISHNIEQIVITLNEILKQSIIYLKCKRIIFVPGNHDLWQVNDLIKFNTVKDKLSKIKASKLNNNIKIMYRDTLYLKKNDVTFKIIGLFGWYKIPTDALVEYKMLHGDYTYISRKYLNFKLELEFQRDIDFLNDNSDADLVISHVPLYNIKDTMYFKNKIRYAYVSPIISDFNKTKFFINGHTHVDKLRAYLNQVHISNHYRTSKYKSIAKLAVFEVYK